MSISTGITGRGDAGSASQLLDLLANPEAYKTQLQAMENATAEYKKYVEAIGVATEITSIRDKLKAGQEQAEADIAEAKALGVTLKAKAEADAQGILDEAKAEAAKLTAQATENKASADALLAQAQALIAKAEADQAKADAAQASANAQAEKLAKTQAEASQALSDAEAAKADILAKHQEFIRGL